jgi:hypothetical protein
VALDESTNVGKLAALLVDNAMSRFDGMGDASVSVGDDVITVESEPIKDQMREEMEVQWSGVAQALIDFLGNMPEGLLIKCGGNSVNVGVDGVHINKAGV